MPRPEERAQPTTSPREYDEAPEERATVQLNLPQRPLGPYKPDWMARQIPRGRSRELFRQTVVELKWSVIKGTWRHAVRPLRIMLDLMEAKEPEWQLRAALTVGIFGPAPVFHVLAEKLKALQDLARAYGWREGREKTFSTATQGALALAAVRGQARESYRDKHLSAAMALIRAVDDGDLLSSAVRELEQAEPTEARDRLLEVAVDQGIRAHQRAAEESVPVTLLLKV
jgi:hypothetical protein